MSILNRVKDLFLTDSPVSHLTHGSIKDIEIYKNELNLYNQELLNKHSSLIEYSNKSYINLVFDNIAEAAGNFWSCNFSQQLTAGFYLTKATAYALGGIASYFVPNSIHNTLTSADEFNQPVSHYDNNSYLKSITVYLDDLNKSNDNLINYHKDMTHYENTDSIRLYWQELGNGFTDLVKGNLIQGVGHLITARLQADLAIFEALTNLGKEAYSIFDNTGSYFSKTINLDKNEQLIDQNEIQAKLFDLDSNDPAYNLELENAIFDNFNLTYISELEYFNYLTEHQPLLLGEVS